MNNKPKKFVSPRSAAKHTGVKVSRSPAAGVPRAYGVQPTTQKRIAKRGP